MLGDAGCMKPYKRLSVSVLVAWPTMYEISHPPAYPTSACPSVGPDLQQGVDPKTPNIQDRAASETPTYTATCPPSSWAEQEEAEYSQHLLAQEADALPSPSYVHQLLSSALLSPLRTALVDWMSSTAQQLGLSSDGLFLAVQLLDRHLAHAGWQLGNPHTQLAAVVALWVALKYEEARPAPPALITRLAASLGASPADLQAAEARLLTSVGHRLSLPTPKTFLRRYLGRVLLSRRLYFTAGYLAELSLLDPGMLLHAPSLAAAATYLWALVLNTHTCTDAHLRQVTGYGLAQVRECVTRLATLHHAACSTSEPCLIAVKYLDPALGSTASVRAVPLDQVVPLLTLAGHLAPHLAPQQALAAGAGAPQGGVSSWALAGMGQGGCTGAVGAGACGACLVPQRVSMA